VTNADWCDAPDAKQYVIERIREALALDPRVGELDIQVKVTANGVYVRGTVNSDERAETISTVLREVCPDRAVHNEVTVMHPTESADEERLS
jgi:osmotically-inducible protein OsmY